MSSTTEGKTILLVEDEALIALAEKATLERFGYGVVTAGTGEKAVELVESRSDIDLILMDINLGPGMNGTEAATRILRKHDLPLIFLSSHTEREVVEMTEGITSYGYIVKNSGDMVLSASLKMAFRLFEAKLGAKETEAALRDQESLYRALVSGLPDILIRYDRDCRHLFVSENVRRIRDFTADELLGKTLREAGFDEDVCRYWETAVKSVFDDGRPHEYEFTYEGRKERLVFSCRLVPEFDADGNVGSVLSISRDVTEQRRITAEYEALFREMLDGFVLNEMIFDGEGRPADYRFLAVNPSFERLTGLKAAEIIGRTVLEVLPGLEPRWIETYGRVVRTGNPAFFEDYLGDLGRHFRVTAYRPAPGRFACIFQNITERKRTEDAMRESEERYRFLADHSTDSIFSVDTDMRFTGANRVLRDWIGCGTDDVIGKTPFELGYSEGDMSDWLPAFRECIETGKIVRKEIAASGADASVRAYEVILVPITGGDGGIKGLRGSCRDITEQKKARNEIQRLLDEKTLLLKEVHHRIRNNILSIEKLLSLQFGTVSTPEALAALQDAASRIAGMRILYEKMLSSGDYREVSIGRYLDDLIDSIFVLFPERNGITLEKRLDDFDIGSRLLFPLGIIVNELLTNIMKYAFTGTAKGKILVSVVRNGTRVRLTVQDNGRGFPEDFDFERTRGFGLMLVKMLSQQVGGTFSVENKGGTKSILEFDLT